MINLEGDSMDFYRERIIALVNGLDDEEVLEIIYRFVRRYLS